MLGLGLVIAVCLWKEQYSNLTSGIKGQCDRGFQLLH